MIKVDLDVSSGAVRTGIPSKQPVIFQEIMDSNVPSLQQAV